MEVKHVDVYDAIQGYVINNECIEKEYNYVLSGYGVIC